MLKGTLVWVCSRVCINYFHSRGMGWPFDLLCPAHCADYLNCLIEHQDGDHILLLLPCFMTVPVSYPWGGSSFHFCAGCWLDPQWSEEMGLAWVSVLWGLVVSTLDLMGTAVWANGCQVDRRGPQGIIWVIIIVVYSILLSEASSRLKNEFNDVFCIL